MLLPLHGIATYSRGIAGPQASSVLRLRSLDGRIINSECDLVLVRSREEIHRAIDAGVKGMIIVGDEELGDHSEVGEVPRLIKIPTKFNYLADGDIIGVRHQSTRFRTLYRRDSKHNSFLVTDRCNHYCLMCSQPPKDVDDRWILDEIRAAIPLIDKDTPSLGFTGGEPLLDWREFIKVLTECRDQLPKTAIHVLSNGRAFVREDVLETWSGVRHPRLTVGIPLYSCVDHVHDYVVQARGAFDETLFGILKLKNRAQRIEVRVVLHALTAPTIVETCKWLARNLPFVDHVALMGLENTGFAIANHDLLWIDPVDYREELADGVGILASARVKVSVYNLPLCLLDRSVWPYAVQSISDWKNGYVEECDVCVERSRCSGFFTSGRPRRSRGIAPIQ